MGAVLGHVWSLSKGEKDSLGLSCTEEGLFLGGTPLVERRDARFFVRPQPDLERLLSRAYGAEIGLDRVMPGLAVVSSALGRSDLCLARIAAVQLRLPDVTDAAKRHGMVLEDALIKRERGEDRLLRGDGDWDPDQHPRTGTSPNPGWFAPKDGSDDALAPTPLADVERDAPVTLPPGKRIERLARLVERIANATPEQADELRAEIKREFYDVGDKIGGDILIANLSDALEMGSNRNARQAILDNLEIYTHTEPAEEGQFHAGIPAAILAMVPFEPELPPEAPPPAEASPPAEVEPTTPKESETPAEPPPAATGNAAERTPAQNRQARNLFKNNKEAARQAWEQRTGKEWPIDARGDPWPAEHTPSLKSGGDPMTVSARLLRESGLLVPQRALPLRLAGRDRRVPKGDTHHLLIWHSTYRRKVERRNQIGRNIVQELAGTRHEKHRLLWGQAIEHCSSIEWENLCLEAANQFRERLVERSMDRFRQWNVITAELKQATIPLVQRKIEVVMRDNDLPKRFEDMVQWDILHLCMEAEYADVTPPDFYAAQAYWYVKGHFPCGWHGPIDEFPKGTRIVY
jgi:hypothetical protein